MSHVRNPEVVLVTDKSAFTVVTDIINENPEMDEPFMMADLGDVVMKYKLWKLKMPRVKPFYAVKCNESQTVLRLLAALGTGFDCASKTEIERVLSIGVSPDRIIYANTCKHRSYIKAAARAGVKKMTFDNESELHKIKAFHSDAELVIRVRVDDRSSAIPFGIKFGCEVEDARHLLEIAMELDMNVIGVSFHVGSKCQDSSAYSLAIACCRSVFNIAADVGFRMNFLDIGGGFPGFKGHNDFFKEISSVVSDALEEHFPPQGGTQVIAEPGRYFVASAFTLYTSIVGKRETVSEDHRQTCMYYVSDGVHGSFCNTRLDQSKAEAIALVDPRHRPVMKSSVWGPTCDGNDVILRSCKLPRMNVGEWLMFENMGAYTTCASTTFNGFQRAAIHYLLPANFMEYLHSLPTWNDLLKSFGEQAHNFGNTNLSSKIVT